MATIGVKVELEGAQSYKQSMSQMTSQTKLYQAEVKKLSENIKNGNNTFQNRIALGKALENQLKSQKEQEALLKDQIEKVAQAEGEDSQQCIKLKTQYENLQAAIAKTEQSIKDNGGTLDAVGAKFEEIGQKISAVGDKMSSFGDSLTKKITAPIMAVGGASLAAFNEVDSAMDTIIRKTGATGDALEEMEDIAQNIATTLPTSFDTAGNAVGEVNTRFGLTGDALEELSTKFIKFAELNGTDVSSSIDTVQSAMAAFGLSADEAGTFLDTLNKAGQDTGISVDTLAQSMTTNAASLKEMGYSASDSAMFIANLSKQGIDASSVMAGMKKALTNATNEGKTMDEAMAELQATMESASSDTEAYQAAIDLFGSKAGVSIAEACQSGRLSFEALGTSMEDFAGNIDDTFEATLDPVDELQVHMNELKVLGTDIANSLMPMISSAMEKFGEIIQKISDAWNGLSEGQQEFIVKAALIAAAIGPVISVIGRVVSFIGTITSGIGALMPVISTIGTALTATIIPAIGGVIAAIAPFLPIIAAVGAAIAAVVLIVKNWGTITDWISEKWQMFTDWIQPILESIKGFFQDCFDGINNIIQTIIGFITAYIQLQITVWMTIFNAIKEFITTIFTAIKTTITTVLTAIKTTFTNIFNAIKTFITTIFTAIKTTITTKITAIKTTITTKLNEIKNTFTDLRDAAISWGRDMIQNFIDGILAKWESLKQTVSNVANSVKSFLGFSEPKEGPLSNFHTYGPDMMKSYAEGIENAKYLVEQAVSDVAMDVNSVLTNPFDYDEVYSAIREGASSATTRIVLNNREVTRALGGMGVVFNG